MNYTRKYDLAPGKMVNTCARYTSVTGDSCGSKNSYPVFNNSSSRSNFDATVRFFKLCCNKRCKTCPNFSKRQTTLDSNAPIACQSSNVIYLLECSSCSMKYIGQTSNSLNIRINLHRSNINNYKPSKYHVEFNHFSIHNFDSVIIHILDIVPNLQDRLVKENFYIINHKTLVPYGLNDLFNNTQITPQNSQSFKLFSNTSKKTTRGCRGGRKRNKNKLKSTLDSLTTSSFGNFVEAVSTLETNFSISFIWKPVKEFIYSLDYDSFMEFGIFLQELQSNNKHFLILINDIYKCRRIQLGSVYKKPANSSSIYFTIRFKNPSFDKINFTSIFQEFYDIFPCKNVSIKKTFKYDIPFGRRIFNYNQFAKNIHLNRDTVSCFCNDPALSNFINADFGHVLTGDLNIVTDSILKNILAKGTKFRPVSKINNKTLLGSFLEDLDIFILKCSNSKNIPIFLFTDWKWNIYNKFKSFINTQSLQFPNFDLKSLKTHISAIQHKFIISPVDKASNNYSFCCKKLYLQLLDNELKTSSTYKKIDIGYSAVAKKILALNKLVNIKNNSISLPYITLYPKFHKTPVGFRFITCGVNTYMNLPGLILSKALNSILNLVTNDNSSWIINNNKPVTDFIKNNTISHIESFDFKDLFTSIPLDKLKEALDYYFYNYNNLINLEPEFWNYLVNFCIFNNFVFNGENVFLQVTGIPQGCNFSSQLANLFLHFYEKNFTLTIPQAFRYIDDFIIFDFKDFSRLSDTIYPPELKLIKTNPNNFSTDFLDLFIKIETGNVTVDIYDKRDSFNFHVIKLIHWNSNISIKVYRNILISQISRLKNICSDFSLFIKNINILKDTLVKNSIPISFINTYCKVLKFS